MEFDSDHIGKEEEKDKHHEGQHSHGTRSGRSSSNFVTFSDQTSDVKARGPKTPPPPALRSATEIKASLLQKRTPPTTVVRRIDETPGMDLISLPSSFVFLLSVPYLPSKFMAFFLCISC